MDTIELISKNFIDENKILKDVEIIAQETGLTLFNENDPQYIALQFFKIVDNHIPFHFNLMMDGKGRFDQTKKDRDFIEEHGLIGYIYFDVEDPYLIKFLKELLKKYPELLVYNEHGMASPTNPFVYTKAHLDVYKGVDARLLLSHPPAKM